MKLKNLIFSTALVFLSMMIYGQNEKQPALKVTATGFSFGMAGAGTANTTEDYNNLAGAVVNPGYFITASQYQNSKYNFGIGGNVSPKIYLSLTPYCKKKGEYRYDRELRISIGSSAGVRRTFNFYRYNDFGVDAFESPTSGNMVYADSVIYDRYTYAESFYGFNVGASFLFKTDVSRRVHFSAGVGMEYAYAFRAFVKVQHHNERSIIYYDPNNKPVFDENDKGFGFYGDKNDGDGTTTYENTNLSGSLQFARVVLPFGIHFRFSNKTQSFFNKVYFFSEMSPGIEFQMVGNDKTYVNPYIGIAMLGFSYRW